MPYTNPETRKRARREWHAKHFRKGSSYSQARSKYAPMLTALMASPGQERLVATFANQNSAGVQAWRIKNNFYGPGRWEARTHGAQLFARYLGPALDTEPHRGDSKVEA